MLKKRNLLFLSLFILGVLLLSSCFLNPPTTEGILKGQIMVPEGSVQAKDLTGQALPDATVNIIDLETGAIIATAVTDANGYYQISVLAGGPYLLEAIKGEVKLQQITCPVEAGIEYDLGTTDCVTTAAALIAQAMMDAGDNPVDIDCAAIIADPNFDDVSSIVCNTIQAGGDPTESVAIEQAVEDFLNTPEPPTTPPTPTYTVTYNGNSSTAGTVPTDANNYEQGESVTVLGNTGSLEKAGYTFDGWNTESDGKGTDRAESSTFNMASDNVTLYAKWAITISTSAISGVTVPVTGKTPVTTITPTAQYTGTVTWAPEDDPFQGNKVYVATITLIAKSGFTLTSVEDNFFAVDGAVATNLLNSGVVRAIFPQWLAVGDSYGGGIVVYILQNGNLGYSASVQHGLIAATEDQSGGAKWGCYKTEISGADGTAVGTGKQNTIDIEAGCTTLGTAADICSNLIIGIYDDWFLPSKEELKKLWLNKDAIGGFVDNNHTFYWSSSEDDAYDAWNQNFNWGYQLNYYKANTYRVRAVRAF